MTSCRIREGVLEPAEILHQEASHLVGLEEPLVGVHPDRVGPFDPAQQLPAPLGDHCESAVRGVDMEPDVLRLAVVGQGLQGIDGPGAGRSGVCAHRDGMESRCPVLRYRPRQGLHVQTTPAPAEPESEPGSAHGWGWSSPDAARGWSKPSPDAEPSAAPRDAAGGIERTLTSRWLVWLGGVTIALAGVFLVKYSIDRDWLSPVVRCALGVLGGVALTVAGEWSRRRRFQRPSGTVDPSAIPTVLSAAGIATLYSDRYDLLGALALVLVLALFATWDIPRLMDSAGRALGEYGWLYDLGRGPVVPPLLVPFALLSAAFAALFGLAGFFALWRARRPWVWATVSAAAPASLLAVGFWRIQEFGIDLNNVRNRALLDQKQTDESVTKLRAIQHAATTGCSQSTYARPTRGATSTSSRPAFGAPVPPSPPETSRSFGGSRRNRPHGSLVPPDCLSDY